MAEKRSTSIADAFYELFKRAQREFGHMFGPKKPADTPPVTKEPTSKADDKTGNEPDIPAEPDSKPAPDVSQKGPIVEGDDDDAAPESEEEDTTEPEDTQDPVSPEPSDGYPDESDSEVPDDAFEEINPGYDDDASDSKAVMNKDKGNIDYGQDGPPPDEEPSDRPPNYGSSTGGGVTDPSPTDDGSAVAKPLTPPIDGTIDYGEDGPPAKPVPGEKLPPDYGSPTGPGAAGGGGSSPPPIGGDVTGGKGSGVGGPNGKKGKTPSEIILRGPGHIDPKTDPDKL